MFEKFFKKDTDAKTASINLNSDSKTELPSATTTDVISADKAVEEVVPPISHREFKAIKKADFMMRLSNIDASKYGSFTLRNDKTKQIVEIKAKTSYQACNIVGWKAKQVSVIKETPFVDKKKEEIVPDTSTLATTIEQ